MQKLSNGRTDTVSELAIYDAQLTKGIITEVDSK